MSSRPERSAGFFEIQHDVTAELTDFVDPGNLDRFEDFLAGMLGVVFEVGQFHHPAMQVGEADGARVDFRVRFGEFDGDVERIRPLHFNALP